MLVSTAGSHARVRTTDTPYYAAHVPYSTYTVYTLLCVLLLQYLLLQYLLLQYLLPYCAYLLSTPYSKYAA